MDIYLVIEGQDQAQVLIRAAPPEVIFFLAKEWHPLEGTATGRTRVFRGHVNSVNEPASSKDTPSGFLRVVSAEGEDLILRTLNLDRIVRYGYAHYWRAKATSRYIIVPIPHAVAGEPWPYGDGVSAQYSHWVDSWLDSRGFEARAADFQMFNLTKSFIRKARNGRCRGHKLLERLRYIEAPTVLSVPCLSKPKLLGRLTEYPAY